MREKTSRNGRTKLAHGLREIRVNGTIGDGTRYLRLVRRQCVNCRGRYGHGGSVRPVGHPSVPPWPPAALERRENENGRPPGARDRGRAGGGGVGGAPCTHTLSRHPSVVCFYCYIMRARCTPFVRPPPYTPRARDVRWKNKRIKSVREEQRQKIKKKTEEATTTTVLSVCFQILSRTRPFAANNATPPPPPTDDGSFVGHARRCCLCFRIPRCDNNNYCNGISYLGTRCIKTSMKWNIHRV